jgi:hypothetical protein
LGLLPKKITCVSFSKDRKKKLENGSISLNRLKTPCLDDPTSGGERQRSLSNPSAPPLLPLAAILFGTRFDSGGSSFSLDLARYLRSRYMFLTYCQFCSEMRNGRQERSD